MRTQVLLAILLLFAQLTKGQGIEETPVDSVSFFIEYDDLTYNQEMQVGSDYADNGFWDVKIEYRLDSSSGRTLYQDLWLYKKNPLVYKTYTVIRYGSNRLIVNSDLINDFLDGDAYGYLLDFGTLMPTGNIWSEKEKLYIAYSYSIPLTDIGIPIVVVADFSIDYLSVEFE